MAETTLTPIPYVFVDACIIPVCVICAYEAERGDASIQNCCLLSAQGQTNALFPDSVTAQFCFNRLNFSFKSYEPAQTFGWKTSLPTKEALCRNIGFITVSNETES